ncbi:SWIM zinc finger family protein [Bacillus sp. 31A1R]|uniref:SWIM zinc finger family protein n=1 Tax=Robertmurraya mangrovi TaxID=3098077 RepID=A0ABU5IXL1_9BACI|nr:SWIM zinc finger family protein [Bacillus sp. 31A1R]MDZ5471856.1 SWIM zinc finger family protein [Bacillus sp. 31A1R]
MPEIPEKYQRLLEEAATEFNSILRSDIEEEVKLVQKGLLLYRQGLVTKLKFENESVLATVQDVTPVQVSLDLNFLRMSECSCPQEDFCRHQLAVFFAAYSHIGSVTEWVEKWRQPIAAKKSAQVWGLQRAKDLLKSTGVLKPNYEKWKETFDESFLAIIQGLKDPKPYVISDLFSIYIKRLTAGAPVEQEWKNLYLLVAYIHSFHKLLHLSMELGHSRSDMKRYYQDIFFSIIDHIEEYIGRLSVQALPFAFDEFIEKMKDDSTVLLTDELELEYERTQLYMTLWTQLFKKKNWREDELQKLEGYFKRMDSIPLRVGIIHQHLLLKRDEEALIMIKDIKNHITPYMLVWLDYIRLQKDNKRMGPYIEEFISQLRGYLAELGDTYACFDFTRWANRIISSYCTETNKMDLYEKALLQTLPYSFRDYEDLLFTQRSFEKWGELQAFIGLDMTSISKDKIKELQKENPEVLLPLYHQSIQKHISFKNRGNYRQAVRELKKIKTIYKKLKRLDDWEYFFQSLLERTKRLRAFHEECQRGKLINA